MWKHWLMMWKVDIPVLLQQIAIMVGELKEVFHAQVKPHVQVDMDM